MALAAVVSRAGRAITITERLLAVRGPAADASLKLLLRPLGLSLEPEDLGNLGIDLNAPLLVMRSSESWLARFSLSDRRRFQAWLARISEGQKKSIRMGRERAMVMFPESDEPIACLIRLRAATCQLGLNTGKDPLSLLRSVVSVGEGSVMKDEAIRAALGRLGDSELVLLVRPARLRDELNEAITERTERNLRFESDIEKRRIALKAAHQQSLAAQRLAAGIKGIVIAASESSELLEARAEIALTERLADELKRSVGPAAGADPVFAWAETPSLARLTLKLEPKHLAAQLRALGFKIPSSKLTGSVGVLALGLDPECEVATSEQAGTEEALPFMFPAAVAIGTRGQLEQKELGFGKRLAERGDGVYALKGKAAAGPIELATHDEALLIGTGTGSGSAARRRWSQAKGGSSSEDFLDLRFDLPAIFAAVTAADLDSKVRPELRAVGRFARELAPLFRRYKALSLKGRTEPRRIDLHFRLESP